jgi:L-fucose mutarotase
MLKGISPILSPELLKILMEMGNATNLIGDGNFPAATMAQRLVAGWDGHGVPAILTPLCSCSAGHL